MGLNMDNNLDFNIYCGSTRGILAHTRFSKQDVKPKYHIEDRDSEITCLEWGRNTDELLVGGKSGRLRLYNTALASYTTTISDLQGSGSIVGAGVRNNVLIAARSDGIINTWENECKGSFSLGLNNGGCLLTMKCNENRENLMGTGGEKNDFNLWDIERETSVFQAKSLGHDSLNLPLPTTIRDIAFFRNQPFLSACVTKEGNVLLYDDRSQRKPIGNFHEPKASFTTIASANRDWQFFAGTTRGYMQLVDLKMNKCLSTFQSFTGSITGIMCDVNSSIVTTTCLDRHLRVHDIDSKKLLFKSYMKLSLSKILIKQTVKEEPKDEETNAEIESVEDEYDELFDNMATVTDGVKVKKTKRIADVGESDRKESPKPKKKSKVLQNSIVESLDSSVVEKTPTKRATKLKKNKKSATVKNFLSPNVILKARKKAQLQ